MKNSTFKPVTDEAKINYNEKETLEKINSRGDQEKTIKILQTRLQTEIIQKEHILSEKRKLEVEFETFKREIIEQNDGQQKVNPHIHLKRQIVLCDNYQTDSEVDPEFPIWTK